MTDAQPTRGNPIVIRSLTLAVNKLKRELAYYTRQGRLDKKRMKQLELALQGAKLRLAEFVMMLPHLQQVPDADPPCLGCPQPKSLSQQRKQYQNAVEATEVSIAGLRERMDAFAKDGEAMRVKLRELWKRLSSIRGY
jgi:DNA repair exonuclease SbcCD ATPase subunit